MLQIAVGHRTFPDHNKRLSVLCSVNLSERANLINRRSRITDNTLNSSRNHANSIMADKRSGDDLESPAKRLVTKSTVEKLIRDSDKELNTTIWLGYKMKDRDHVACLKCTVCSMFRERACRYAKL